MSANLDFSQVAANQNQKEVTINDAFGEVDAALTESLSVDFTSGDVTLTASQFRSAFSFISANLSVARELTIPAVQRFFFVDNAAGSDTLDVTKGSTTIQLTAGANGLFYSGDGANDLVQAAGGAGGGAGAGFFEVEDETATSYDLVLADAGKYKTFTNGSAQSVTVQAQSAVAWEDDTEIVVQQAGAGAVTIVADGGVTINVDAGLSLVLAGQYAAAVLKRTASDVWTLTGALTPADDKVGRLDEQSTDVASATNVDLSAITGDYLHITGTTAIETFQGLNTGQKVWLEFDGALTLTHSGTDLILPTGANVTTAAGDTMLIVGIGTNDVKCLTYQRQDGTALA